MRSGVHLDTSPRSEHFSAILTPHPPSPYGLRGQVLALIAASFSSFRSHHGLFIFRVFASSTRGKIAVEAETRGPSVDSSRPYWQ